jgi:hypothetical protein
MADELRIGLSELLRKAQMEGDAEFLKEGVRALSQGPDGDGGRGAYRRCPSRAYAHSQGSAQRLPPEDLGYEGGSRGALSPEGEGLELLPLAVGAK